MFGAIPTGIYILIHIYAVLTHAEYTRAWRKATEVVLFFGGGTYLHSDLRQVDLQRQLLPAVHVRVVGLFESSLQLVQLEGGECCSVPAVFLLRVFIVGQFSVSVRWARARGRVSGAVGATHTCGDTRAWGPTQQLGHVKFRPRLYLLFVV